MHVSERVSVGLSGSGWSAWTLLNTHARTRTHARTHAHSRTPHVRRLLGEAAGVELGG